MVVNNKNQMNILFHLLNSNKLTRISKVNSDSNFSQKMDRLYNLLFFD